MKDLPSGTIINMSNKGDMNMEIVHMYLEQLKDMSPTERKVLISIMEMAGKIIIRNKQ